MRQQQRSLRTMERFGALRVAAAPFAWEAAATCERVVTEWAKSALLLSFRHHPFV
jgi:hypothetical protein